MRALCYPLLFELCGCVLPGRSYHVTDYEPFSSYMGHDLTIKRATCLIKEHSMAEHFVPADMLDMTAPSFDMAFRREIQNGRLKPLAILPPGTVVRLLKVRRWWNGESGVVHIDARGYTRLPQTSEKVTFEYEWNNIAEGNRITINRAPWNDETVPPNRYVGKDETINRGQPIVWLGQIAPIAGISEDDMSKQLQRRRFSRSTRLGFVACI